MSRRRCCSPQLAGDLLDRAHGLGIRAAFVAGDEVYGGRHVVSTGPSRAVTAAAAVRLIPARAWHRMRTGSGTKGTRHYDWAMLPMGTGTGTACCWPSGTAIPAR